MRVSWLKYKNDKNSFKFFKNIGMDVYELEDLEKTDEKLGELIRE